MPCLPAFFADHPSLNFEAWLDERDTNLVTTGMDVAFVIGRPGAQSGTARKIGECQRRVIATPAYVAAKGAPRGPDDLLTHEAIIHDHPDGGANWTFRRGNLATSITLNGRLRVSMGEGVRAAVLAGLGLAVGSEWLFGPELKCGAVVSVLRDWLLPPADLWAVTPEGRRASAKARAFTRFVESELTCRNRQTPNMNIG
jgi:DNA-binding transcriptional LysR family regulator